MPDNAAQRVNRIQDSLAEAILQFLRERSTALSAVVIDVLAKDTLGNYCGAEVVPQVFTRLRETIAPEELGKRLRRVGLRVGLAPPAIMWVYQFGRLQKYVDRGWPEKEVDLGDGAEVINTVEYWATMMSSYRDDGNTAPGQNGAPHSFGILDEEKVRELADRAIGRRVPSDTAALRRALGKIELYIFVIHAEAREGIFHHGPYPLGDGRVLVVKELTDLQNQWMPWVTPERRLSTSRLVMPMVLEGVSCEFDMFGTLYSDPADYFPRLIGFDLLVGEELTPITEGDLFELAESAQALQKGLFRELASWDERYRVQHAAPQFANVLAVPLEAAGCTTQEVEDLVIEPSLRIGEAVIDEVLAGRGANVWDYVGSGHLPLFPPVSD